MGEDLCSFEINPPPCIWVLRHEDSNKPVTEKVFYYSTMKNISLIKSSSDINNKEIFSVYSSSSLKVWISSDSDTEEKDNIDTDDQERSDSDMLEILSSLVFSLWQKIKLHINNDFAVTGWMLCVIPKICKDEKYHSYSDHRKQVKKVIKTLFHELFENEMDVTQDIFWTGYTDLDNNNGSFDGDEFIWKSKDIRYGNW